MRTYGVSELFYSLQGEGAFTGTPMAFARLSGCNLWDGHEAHRERGTGSCADWCDASFLPKLGKMPAEEIARRLRTLTPDCHYACVTGGEPTLQWDEELADALVAAGFDQIHMETNGTTVGPLPRVGWLTLSPKRDRGGAWTHKRPAASELKVVHSRRGHPLSDADLLVLRRSVVAEHYFVQPCDEGYRIDTAENERDAVALVLRNPSWRLSLQTNKTVGLP
mgnify:CR=1 FL=1